MENFNIIGIFIAAICILSTYLLIKVDAEADADQIKRGIPVDHTPQAIVVMLIATAFLGLSNLLNLFFYDFNLDLIKLIGMWIVWFASARFLFFTPYLNKLRGLSRDYLGSGEGASKIDKALSHIPKNGIYLLRVSQFMFATFFLVHFIMNYYAPYHPNLEHNFATAVFIAIGIGVAKIVRDFYTRK